jgi:hypothetical protein
MMSSTTVTPGVPSVDSQPDEPDIDEDSTADPEVEEECSPEDVDNENGVSEDSSGEAETATSDKDSDTAEIEFDSTTTQASFDSDGTITTPDTTETSLGDWGLDVGRERETRYEQEAASEFGIDDRVETGDDNSGDQTLLFPDTDDDQLTLTGEKASTQSLFEQRQRRQQREQGGDDDATDPWRSAKDDDKQTSL